VADQRRPILLLVNPVAGGKPASPRTEHPPLEPEAMRDRLSSGGLAVTLRLLGEDDDAGRLAARGASEGHDVVVAGGDGTVRPVATALVGTDASVGVVPRGSWNNIATGWGLPREEPDAVDVIAAGRQRLVDVGLAWQPDDGGDPAADAPETATAFFEAAGVGLDAAGFGAAAVGARYGTWQAILAAWRALRRRRTPMRLTVDGRVLRTGAPAVTACIGPYSGFGFALAPEADPADGELDLVVFSGMSTVDVLRHYLAVARNRPRREPRVTRIAARRIEIIGTHRTLPAHADGEPLGVTPVVFAVRPAALRIFARARQERQGQEPGNPVAAAASAPNTRA
jgi:diacylglycerol kinase (ATP)